MTMIKIPTAKELTDSLAGLDRLLTAKEWERAAIVYAFTTNNGRGGDTRAMPETGHCFPVPIAEFARLGLAGLAKRDTVAMYRQRWQEARDKGLAPSVEPGDEIELPDLPWPPTRTGTDGDAKVESRVEKVTEYLADPEVQEDPRVAKAVSSVAHAQQTQLRKVTEEAIVAAVAEANQVTVEQAKKTRTVDVARVREAVEQEAARRPEFPAAKRETYAKRVADNIVGGRAAAAKREERRKQTLSANWMHVDTKLGHAYQDLKEVLDYQQRGLLNLPAEETELMHDSIAKVRAVLDLVSLATTGTVDIDWDAEMEKLS